AGRWRQNPRPRRVGHPRMTAGTPGRSTPGSRRNGRRRPRRVQRSSAASVSIPTGSVREDLAVVGERLELEGVAGRVDQEHGRLLADLAGESGVWLDDELDAGCEQP